MKRKASASRLRTEEAGDDFKAKTVDELRRLLRQHGLSTAGRKAKLISRLAQKQEEGDQGTPKEEEEEECMAEIDYIVEERKKRGGFEREYLVRWVDGEPEEWLPEPSLRGTPALKEWKDSIPPEDDAPSLSPQRLVQLVFGKDTTLRMQECQDS